MDEPLREQTTPDIRQAIATMLAEARAGDYASAIMTAMLIHLYPKDAQEAGVSALYESLLLQSLQSSDPELLACLAEELMLGERLASDGRMAHRASAKANEISGFMGAYVVGRIAARSNPDFAVSQFRKARKARHLASMVYEHRLIAQKVPLLGIFLRYWLHMFDFCRAFSAVIAKDRQRLWRALDVMGREDIFRDMVGSDREIPFSRIDAFLPENRKPNEIAAADRPTATQSVGG